jgi:hypothetical protein
MTTQGGALKDKTIVAREERHRLARKAEGWQRLTVWVPTEEDADAVRELARERRARAEARLPEKLKELNVTPETAHRIALAIAQHGSPEFITSSGALLDLMTELTEQNDPGAVSEAFCLLAQAKPASAPYVAKAIPAKVSNYIIRHRGVDGSKFYNWSIQKENKDWAERLIDAVRDRDRFTMLIDSMVEDIKRTHH